MKRSRPSAGMRRFRRAERWRRLSLTVPPIDLGLTQQDLLEDLDPGGAGRWERP